MNISNMTTIRVSEIKVHIVETDEKEFNTYTRYNPANWTVRMGESDEQVYDCKELEAAFQASQSMHHP